MGTPQSGSGSGRSPLDPDAVRFPPGPLTDRSGATGPGQIPLIDGPEVAGAWPVVGELLAVPPCPDVPVVPELRGAGWGGCEETGADCGLLGGTGAVAELLLAGRFTGTTGAAGGGIRKAGRGAGRAAGM